MAHDTLPLKAQNASLPLREAGAILHIGMIMGGEAERLCRFVGILVYSSRQAFLMRYNHPSPPCRKGAEGQEGEDHGFVSRLLTKRIRLENRCLAGRSSLFALFLLCGKGFQPVCAVEGRMVIRPSTAASSISCSRKYSIRIS